MITQPDPQLEARPAVPDVQHRLPLHLPGWAHLRPVPQSTRATGTRPLNGALVGLQLLIGYEWLLAGGDKFLLGAFPPLPWAVRLTTGSSWLPQAWYS